MKKIKLFDFNNIKNLISYFYVSPEPFLSYSSTFYQNIFRIINISEDYPTFIYQSGFLLSLLNKFMLIRKKSFEMLTYYP